ncbi:Sjogren's syndrome/scleroderma autoantigen 1 family protein [Salarchaeum japonicum]|uniref:Sjogren's syndrome/scleroderma autoantigen 1 family protein n=1 Tax=Salarchaeum japonicum TaxID=555573 RepID=A0AAV3T0W3_9EURY|nr:Sjogren's syndrome/scleroderma autoantigen 1 family protein [Salarchaeum japonicum]
MSDEFDREEEKRKLREKYAKDREDREVTGRMSDLLLQGATMTNKHCDRCGSPIFRQNGEEFCPTCRAEGNQPQTDEPADQSGRTAAEPTETGDAQPTPEPTRAPATTADTPDPAADEPTEPAGSPASADTADARAALATSIETLAQRASDADDPRRAKEFLEAAREAADTLHALDR